MNILWVTIDRSNRVATIFDPLREELSKIVNIDVVMKKLPLIAGEYQQKTKNRLIKEKNIVNVKKANEYDLVMLDAPFAFIYEDWVNIKTKKAVLFEDQHGHNINYSKKLKNMGFNYFFTRYENIINRHEHLKGSNIYWLPHSIDPIVFNDYNLKKENDVLMIGRIGNKIYPLRNFIHSKLKDKKYYKRVKRPVETVDFTKKWPVGVDYAKLINSSKIVFSSLSVLEYPVLKFFEIPACNAALFSNYNTELKKLGFKPNINMVEINKSINIEKYIENWLKRNDDLIEISKNGYNLIHERHTSKKRAEDFLNYL